MKDYFTAFLEKHRGQTVEKSQNRAFDTFDTSISQASSKKTEGKGRTFDTFDTSISQVYAEKKPPAEIPPETQYYQRLDELRGVINQLHLEGFSLWFDTDDIEVKGVNKLNLSLSNYLQEAQAQILSFCHQATLNRELFERQPEMLPDFFAASDEREAIIASDFPDLPALELLERARSDTAREWYERYISPLKFTDT